MNIRTNINTILGIFTITTVVVGLITTLVLAGNENRRKTQRELFNQGALQGASVVLQSNQQGVTNMDVRVFLDAAWWLHTNKGGVK